MSESGTSMKPPSFDGDHENFTMWTTKFQAYAALRGFLPALEAAHEARMPTSDSEVIDTTDANGKAKEKARNQNHWAVAGYALSFTKNQLVDMIYASSNDEFPGG